MTVPPLVAELARAGVTIRLVGEDRLEVTAPGGRLTRELRGRIASHKPELVSWLARDCGGPGATGGSVSVEIRADPARWHEPFAPSDLQVSFLVGSGAGFEHPVRPHQYLEFDLDELDPSRFEAALNQELRRQRANVVVVGDDLRLAAVPDPAPVPVRVTDLRGRPATEVEQGIARVRAAMRRRELPLDRWPWMDVEISRYGRGRGRLHYNNNNFFSDAWGTMRFLDSVLRRYRRPEQAVPELAVSYRDCVLALAEQEESPRGLAAKRYWTDRMPGWPGPPELPLASGVDSRQRSCLERREMVLPADEWAAVKEASGARGLTPSTVACAGYAEVLAYWSGSRHFLLNHMISHRTSLPRRAADVIGNFAALYPLEVDWRHTEPFAERARRLQSQVLSDLAQLSWSGSRVLQAWNQYRGTPGRAACPYAIGSALFVGPVDRPLHSLLETPQVVLDCETWELRDGGLWVVWDVIEAMFPPGLVDAMLAGYRTLLTRLATGDRGWEDPAPDLLPAAERQRRTRLNRAGTPVPAQRLAGRLPALAARSPDHPAVITPTATLTYRELHRRSARLAARLRPASGTGVRPGDLVAVVLPKGWEQVVAVLGVLTAGAAYVPIDPEWPAARIRHLLGDTGARAVLTAPESVAGLATLVEVPVLAVDAVTDEPRPGAVAPPGGGSTASAPAPPAGDDRAGEDTAGEDTAYVIYTSGSTGRPKGVMLDHRGPLNTILDINRRFGIYSGDTIFGVSSLCFDLSVYDIFGAVAAGATLVLPSGAPDPAGWVRMVSELRVTVWNSVPALMQLFVEEAAAAGVRLPALRVVLLSGDWIPVGLPARIRAVAPEARVVSLGGATEASIWSICHPVDRPDPSWVSIPYGRPLANQSWHILDATGRDAPTWSAGQLYIGGRGVALGYLGDPERTATAFVPHPRTGERLYRTGDLGRYLPDGEIELLGRIDDQLKIQGWRVEPGEIEHALATHPGVRRAAVVARRSASGRQLAGFVTGAADLEPDSLRAFLAARLPGHLVPVTVTVLESLPLTANGKLDRRALAAREPAGERATREFQPPRTATEAALAGIYQEVLGNGPVGIHDDFFARGGESFAALRVASLVARRLGRPIAPGVLLEHRSVAGLAGWLGGPDGGWSPLVWLRPPGDRQPWFFVHPAGGGVLCYRQLAGLLDGPVGAFQAPGPAVGREPLARVEDLAAAYLPDLLAAQPRGPYRLGGWSSGAVIAFELAHRLERRGERVERLVVIDAPAPSTPRPVREEDVLRWFREDLDTGAGAAGPAPGPDRAELAAALAVFRGVVRACHDYHPPPVTADITLVRAAQGTVTEFADHPYGGSPDWGWKALTTGSVAAVTVPGTHHSLLAGPHVVAVSEAVTGRRRPDRLRPAAARRL